MIFLSLLTVASAFFCGTKRVNLTSLLSQIAYTPAGSQCPYMDQNCDYSRTIFDAYFGICASSSLYPSPNCAGAAVCLNLGGFTRLANQSTVQIVDVLEKGVATGVDITAFGGYNKWSVDLKIRCSLDDYQAPYPEYVGESSTGQWSWTWNRAEACTPTPFQKACASCDAEIAYCAGTSSLANKCSCFGDRARSCYADSLLQPGVTITGCNTTNVAQQCAALGCSAMACALDVVDATCHQCYLDARYCFDATKSCDCYGNIASCFANSQCTKQTSYFYLQSKQDCAAQQCKSCNF